MICCSPNICADIYCRRGNKTYEQAGHKFSSLLLQMLHSIRDQQIILAQWQKLGRPFVTSK